MIPRNERLAQGNLDLGSQEHIPRGNVDHSVPKSALRCRCLGDR